MLLYMPSVIYVSCDLQAIAQEWGLLNAYNSNGCKFLCHKNNKRKVLSAIKVN